MLAIKNFTGGKYREAVHQASFENTEPATGQAYATIPDSDAADVELAVAAAAGAFKAWSECALEQRAAIMNKMADLIEVRLEEFAQAECRDSGKPIETARTVDIPRAISNLRFFAAAATQFASESHYSPQQGINYTLRQPIGIVGCISPWNLPLYLFTWKIAPAIASGNCVVAKPSEITPYTAFLLGEICQLAGLPGGVLNILHGYGHKVGQAIVEHPQIKAISFTGGTETGKRIATTVAPLFKKTSLELGGKNPTIIFDDCDFEHTVNEAVRAAFSNTGQICLCGSRIFVQEGLYEKFKEAFVAKVKQLQTGDPLETSTQVGAITSRSHQQKILSYIALAKEEGGTVLCGGETISIPGRCSTGYFIQPTVIEGLPATCRTQQEEIFGPVVTLTPFHNEADVLAMANDTPYGLAANLWTADISRAHRLAQQLHFGIVWVNAWMVRDLRTPFGGVKNSGVGREGGFEAMRFFTEAKNVFIRY
jgi:aminomuconate-semialdehyde/2-hydroxymuconate-6-semialdehyde dehydrogenase